MINKAILSLLFSFLIFGAAFPQSDTINARLNNYDDYVDYIYENMKYPTVAVESGIQGRVEFGFIISKAGCIESIEITSDSNRVLNRSVIKTLRETGCDWIPAMIDDNPVSVKMSSYVDFKLEDKRKKKNK